MKIVVNLMGGFVRARRRCHLIIGVNKDSFDLPEGVDTNYLRRRSGNVLSIQENAQKVAVLSTIAHID